MLSKFVKRTFASAAKGNRGVVYKSPGVVAVENLAYPKLELPEQKRKCDHGVILKVVATNICGSDQHMVRYLHDLILMYPLATNTTQIS
jgi:threonine dehydrogenase-like Zn-dependent dehydrogenase